MVKDRKSRRFLRNSLAGQIVAQIQAEEKIVNENKKLIEIFQKKISETISALWS